MPLNSSNSNYNHATASSFGFGFGIGTTLPPTSPSPGFPNPIYAGNGTVGQPGLTKISLDQQWAQAHNDTEKIMRTSEMVRAQLMEATTAASFSNVGKEREGNKKAREMVQAQLLLASALPPPNKKPTSLSTQLVHASTVKVEVQGSQRFSQRLQPQAIVENETNTERNLQEPFHYNGFQDGRLHSLPCMKNGPYTCPKCTHVFATSQRFAAHVSSTHYKYETKAEKRKRFMAKIRGRALRIHSLNNDGLTFVPAPANSQNHGGATSNWFGEKEFIAAEGVQIKPEPVNT